MSIETARRVLGEESEAIRRVSDRIDERFERIMDLLEATQGRVIVTGMGKCGFIAQKVSATLASTGTPSLYLHPAEAFHGDLGRITGTDLVLAFSNSGETEEVIKLLPTIKKIGARLVAVTGNLQSTLAQNSDGVLDSHIEGEACPMNLAPTTSTTVMLALGDALAIALLERKKFTSADFALYHPGGALGKRLLLKVEDIMRPRQRIALVTEDLRIKEVLFRITASRTGSACVVDPEGRLQGIFTDGDLRRHIDSMHDLLQRPVSEVMTRNPHTIQPSRLAAEALEILRDKKIDELPVVDEQGGVLGLLDVQDILDAGLV